MHLCKALTTLAFATCAVAAVAAVPADDNMVVERPDISPRGEKDQLPLHHEHGYRKDGEFATISDGKLDVTFT